MIRARLPEAEAPKLEGEPRSAEGRKLRDRPRTALLAHKGRKHPSIAPGLTSAAAPSSAGSTPAATAAWPACRPRRPLARGRASPASFAGEVKAWVIGGPASQGLGLAGWPHGPLAGHLGRAHGIKASRSAMRRPCSKIDIRPYRPTYRRLRGAPARRARAREGTANPEKKRRPARPPS